MDWLGVPADEIAAAGGAVASLNLIYFGVLSGGFATFAPDRKSTVHPGFRRRVWLALVGLLLSLIPISLASWGILLDNPSLIAGALFVLIAALAWLIITAGVTVRDLRRQPE